MLPKNVLVNLLYRYKLAKQAALNEYVKEAYLKQLQYQDQIEKLIDLYRANSLVKKASLLNDLYEQVLLTKLAQEPAVEQSGGLWSRLSERFGNVKDKAREMFGNVRDKTKQVLGAIGSKIKSNKQGLIGGGIGLLTGLGAGLLSGRSSAYERGKADALKNLNEEELKALLALMGGNK